MPPNEIRRWHGRASRGCHRVCQGQVFLNYDADSLVGCGVAGAFMPLQASNIRKHTSQNHNTR